MSNFRPIKLSRKMIADTNRFLSYEFKSATDRSNPILRTQPKGHGALDKPRANRQPNRKTA